ncbi:MAG: selenocysteine-specific translation elongation factor [Acidobacteria bacterium ACB1]|nr:Selenocysteine-specific elongation factor [Pyrinomonadaceae bacterium]MCE7961327.1 selenocysteine-specific translation elongation factor [Acidobacteria bacterium ACB1]
MSVVIGTAGHIDHGKTTLVKALTGVDTDRLPDEKRRGITIDIGFAEMRLGERSISFIDVPGHERFVRNMLAGASGIDAVMLVVAADDGVMPQTREHFEICRLLGVEDGVIVITKASLADGDMIDLVRDDVADLVKNSFLANARVFMTDARDARGIDDLRAHLFTFARDRDASANKAFRLPIDRVFSRKGFGTIVTGTLAAGEINDGDEVEIFPLDRTARVRGLQTHDRGIAKAFAGMRVAVNLAGVERRELERGLIAGAVGAFRPAKVFDATVEVCRDAPPLKDRQRVRVHVGTKELMARASLFGSEKEIAAGQKGFARFRLEGKTVLFAGERFIVRSYSPMLTIAGGTVLDPQCSKRHLKGTVEFLLAIERDLFDTPGRLKTLIASTDDRGAGLSELSSFSGDRRSRIEAELDPLVRSGEVVRCGELFASADVVGKLEESILTRLGELHAAEPLASGFRVDDLKNAAAPRASAEIYRESLSRLAAKGKVAVEGEMLRLAATGVSMSEAEQRFTEAYLHRLESAGLEVPRQNELLSEIASQEKVSLQAAEKLVRLLLSDRRVLKVSDEFYFSRNAIDALVAKVRALAGHEIDVPKFKDVAGVSRKYAIPLLEYFDREKITARRKDGSRVVL